MGKGGGKAHTPVEAKDNLKSTQMMSVIDAIGEGPIEGPVKGLQSILVNKTPLTDTDGNPVIHGVTAVWRAGEQEQTPPEGFESSGAETALGVEVNRPGFPGECFICELRLPDHCFRWKHNKLFLLLPEEYGPAFPAIVDCYTSPPTLVWPVPLLHGFSSAYGVLPPLCKGH